MLRSIPPRGRQQPRKQRILGTSSSYGGSNSQAWRDFREAWSDLPSVAPTPAADVPNGQATDQALSTALDSLGHALAVALLGTRQPFTGTLSLASLLPKLHHSEAAGSTASGRSTDTNTGFSRGGRRNVVQQAARGGAAIGAARAYRERDPAALAEYRTTLEELDALSPRERCTRILDLVLGEAAHPDEAAIRRAAVAEIKSTLDPSITDRTAIDSLRDFIASMVVELSMVELRKQLREGTTTPAEAAQKERTIKAWAATKMRTMDLGVEGVVTSTQCHQAAARMADRALRLLKAGESS